jgi:hypothetical protein
MSEHLNRRLEVLAKQIAAEKAKQYQRVPDFPIAPPNVSTQVLNGKVKATTADGQELWIDA